MKNLEFIKRILKPPIFADSEEQYVASISHKIALMLIALAICLMLNNFFNFNYTISNVITISSIIIAVIALYLLHKGYSKPIRIIIPLDVLAFLTLLLYQGSGIHDISIIGFPIVIVLAGLLLGRKAPLIFALFCMLALLFIYYGEKVGFVTSKLNTDFVDVINISLYLTVMAALLRLLIGNLSDSLSQTRRQEKALAQSNRELEKYQTQLEELVDERTRELSQTLSDLQSTQEELLQAKEAAERANQAKSDFLSQMSHELRTPLNGILGYTQILQRDTQLRTTHKNQIGIIHQSGHHLLTLINDILDLSKIEARKMELYVQNLHLAGFLFTVVGIIRMRAEEKDVLFVYQPDERLPTRVRADEKRLRQVLINLLGNAVKFTHQGQVTLKVSLWGDFDESPGSEASPQQTLRFEIIDTGGGMTEEQLAKIFLPFEQVGEVKQRAKGTGLGLAITRQLVNLMGGEVFVSSELGKGSTFWFDLTLPVVAAKEKEKEVPLNRHLSGYQGARRHILLVDDKSQNRLVLRDFLEPLGFQISEAENGREEVELARQIQPDLILTDLVMPVMNGFEAVKEIRQFARDLPIIAISANAFEADQKKSRFAGCDAFLPKPIEEQKLLALISQLLALEWAYSTSENNEQTFANPMPDGQSAGGLLVAPPAEELEALYELAMLGKISDIRKWAAHIEQLEETYAPFANKVRELAQGFEDEKIVALVEKYLDLKSKPDLEEKYNV